MEKVEVRTISSYDFPPKFWKRYVDDVCMALKERPDTTFTDHLNPIEESINITVELESNNKLAFLYKHMETSQQLNSNSHHPIANKIPVNRTLMTRAETVCSNK